MINDRHTKISVICEICTKEFFARKERVDKGQGRFCSKGCFDFYQRESRKQFYGRKDLAIRYKTGNGFSARWYDENGKTKTTSYPRWWWEMNVGEIPEGMIILYKDGNPMNIDPNNFELGTRSQALERANATRKLDDVKWVEYRNNASKRQHKLWSLGVFDHLRGSGHYAWRGGKSKIPYTNDFRTIREFIKNRDNYMCQICGKEIQIGSRSGDVHHIDGDKRNNSYDNLLTLCRKCHSQVHSTKDAPPPILALRSQLK